MSSSQDAINIESTGGNINLKTTAGTVNVDGLNVNVNAKVSAKVKATKIDINGTALVNVNGVGPVNVKSSSIVSLDSPLIQLGGKGALMPALLGPQAMMWMATHIHLSTSPGSPTSPPIIPPLPNILSKTVLVK